MAKDSKSEANAPKANEPRPVTVLKTDRQLSTVRFSSCGKFLAGAGRDALIRLWDLGEPAAPVADPLDDIDQKDKKSAAVQKPPAEPVFTELPRLSGHDGWVSSIAFHPQEQRLFSADTWGRIICWPYAAKEPQPLWNRKDAHDGWIRQIAISPDGQLLATCGMDKKVCLWSTADGKRVNQFTYGEDMYSVAFHPDGKSLVSGDLQGVVKQWDLATGKPEREFDAKILYTLSEIQEVGGVRCLAFDREGSTLLAAGSQPAGGGFVQGTPVARFFDWTTGKETLTLKLGENTDVYVTEVFFHPRGYWIGTTSGQPGKGKLFFLRPGEQTPFFATTKLANCHSVALHPNGVRITVISNAGEAGQRRMRGRDAPYPGNSSPVNIFDVPEPTAEPTG